MSAATIASHVPARPTLAITIGEPAGIGPEICAMLADRHRQAHYPARLVFIGDRDLICARAARMGLAPLFAEFDPAAFGPSGGVVEVWHHRLLAPVVPGHPDATNSESVLGMLRDAIDGCATGAFDALVTAPMQKSVMMDAGIDFTGHTEYLAARTFTPRVVMMLAGGARDAPLRVALVTTHLPLAAVPAAITPAAVRETLAIVATGLRDQFGIAAPRIAVCGLNPHAGEGGHLGREDIDVIVPAIAAAREGSHAHFTGPLPADTVFVPHHAQHYDAIVAMYHDQGLPVEHPGWNA